jgi:SAM-dependent methyltransferase
VTIAALTCLLCECFAQDRRQDSPSPGVATVLFRARDYEYGVRGEWAVARCEGCRFCFQSPLPAAATIPGFYPPSYSAYAPDATLGWMFRVVYWLDARRVVRLIGREGRILDVGCGDGSALLAMRRAGEWDLWGLEMDEAAVARARAAGLEAHRGDLTTAVLPAASFDLIRMGHVIEHVLDPVATLRRAYDLLRPGGVLFGETPNTDCWDFRLFGRYWGALHLPRHLTFFDHGNLRETLTRLGFVDIRLRPRLRTVGWTAGIQNALADKFRLRVPPSGRVRWYGVLIALCLPLTAFQSMLGWPATMAFVARRPIG